MAATAPSPRVEKPPGFHSAHCKVLPFQCQCSGTVGAGRAWCGAARRPRELSSEGLTAASAASGRGAGPRLGSQGHHQFKAGVYGP